MTAIYIGISAFLLFIVCCLFTELDFWESLLVPPFLFFLFFVIFVLLFNNVNEIILIDEKGICLYYKGKISWKYEWDEIRGFRYTKRFRELCVIVSDRKGEAEVVYKTQFGVCKKAKIALKEYYNKPIDNIPIEKL